MLVVREINALSELRLFFFFVCTFCPPVKYAALVCEHILYILAILLCVLQPDGCLALSHFRWLSPNRVMRKSSRPHWGALAFFFLSARAWECRGAALISAGQLGVLIFIIDSDGNEPSLATNHNVFHQSASAGI